jgi:hypothetical protein
MLASELPTFVHIYQSIFIWLVNHDRILTNYRKNKMNLRDHWYKHCLGGIEDVFHILRVCPLAKAIWCNVLTMEVRTKKFCIILQGWIHILTCLESFWKGKLMNGEDHDSVFVRPTHPWKKVFRWTTRAYAWVVRVVVFY